MTSEEIKAKIQQARNQGVPDEVTFKYLNDKGLIPQDKIVKTQVQPIQNVQQEQSIMGTLLNPAKEGIQGLKTLYGGGEQGIANKLKEDIQAGASDIQKGDVLKGIIKSGARTAGDVAGTIYSPVGALIGATGVGKVFDKIGELSQKGGDLNPINLLTDNPAVQEFVLKHPNASEDFGRLMNIIFAKQETGKIEPSTAIARTSEQISSIPKNIKTTVNNLRPTAEQIAQERQAKITSGLNEQNIRLKTVDKSFNKNTIVRQTDKIGKEGLPINETITPIDTFAKYGISPVIEKGSIQMGDYKTGTGELGKIKEQVTNLDSQIDTKLVNSGKQVPVETLRQEAIIRAKNNPEFKQSGTVGSNISKIDARFNDYKLSYGDNLDVAEINNIRKVANKDWNPDTSSVSEIVGDVARDVVYNVIPDKVIRNLLRQQGELLSAKKYAESINGTKVTGGKLGTMALRTTGAIVGSTIPKLSIFGPVAGAIGGEFASRALQQSQFKSLWTELRSLIQRSNNVEQTQSAKNIPKSDKNITNNISQSKGIIKSKKVKSNLPIIR